MIVRPSLLALSLSLAAASCSTAPTLGPGVYCDDSTPCTADALYPLCNPFNHQCVGKSEGPFQRCAADADCTDGAHPLCDLGHRACVACTGPADDGRCQARDATHPRCEIGGGRCVACLPASQAVDCARPTAPICGLSGCRGCTSNAECPSQICSPDGSCVATSDIAYVDNEDGKCAGLRDGSAARPYCEIGEALAVLAGRHHVLVKGRTTPYHRIEASVAWPDPPAIVVGAGRTATPTSRITDATGPCVKLGGARGLTLDGMELSGCTVGVQGFLGGALKLLRSTVSGATSGPGIELHGCARVTLDGAVVRDNQKGGGAALYLTDFLIQNSFIAGNRGGAGGLDIDESSSGALQFITVRDNVGGPGKAGGIECNGNEATPARLTILGSIVVGNSPMQTGNQLGEFCPLANQVAVGLDEPLMPGLIHVPFEWLQSALDYHLALSPRNMPLIDAMTTPAPGYPDHDIDGNLRPKGQGWDIGAQEIN